MLSSVEVSPGAYFVLTAHSLSTEDFEVMGMLLGEWHEDKATVLDAVPLCRSDRRKDRVEVDPKQLTYASDLAEQRHLKVVGWYHSHPHITAAPSAVDARTQGEYQKLDSKFFGIICAAFQGDPELKFTAFQSVDATNVPGGFAPPSYDDVIMKAVWQAKELPLRIITDDGSSFEPLRALAGLQDALLLEEVKAGAKWQVEEHHLWQSFNAAVFHKAVAFLSADSLAPLIHVARAKLEAEKTKLATLKLQLSPTPDTS